MKEAASPVFQAVNPVSKPTHDAVQPHSHLSPGEVQFKDEVPDSADQAKFRQFVSDAREASKVPGNGREPPFSATHTLYVPDKMLDWITANPKNPNALKTLEVLEKGFKPLNDKVPAEKRDKSLIAGYYEDILTLKEFIKNLKD